MSEDASDNDSTPCSANANAATNTPGDGIGINNANTTITKNNAKEMQDSANDHNKDNTKFSDINDTVEIQIHSSQWLLYSGLLAFSKDVGEFHQLMSNVNHGVRQEERTANIINTMLGDPAELEKYRLISYNLDLF